MRTTALLIAATLVLSACGRGSKQADALDHAASQADPAAAASMHNAADAIRDGSSDANTADPNSPAQAAMANAGVAAAGTGPGGGDRSFGTSQLVTPGQPAQTTVGNGADTPGATPHKAGQPVPNGPGTRH